MIKFPRPIKDKQPLSGANGRIKAMPDKVWYLNGKENEKFAQNFAKLCGTKFALWQGFYVLGFYKIFNMQDRQFYCVWGGGK